MNSRHLNPVDRVLAGLGNALRTVAAPSGAGARPNPALGIDEASLDAHEITHAAGLMRVNHAGEVAAQALYQGHASFARDSGVGRQMQAAADEERDHLAWCEQRLSELDAKPSRLSPLWYAGAFAMGAGSSLMGDRWSLGFIAETENQVCEHLDRHLERLPEADLRSRAIVAQMRDEEALHGANAVAAGAARLPVAIKRLMRMTARLMTSTAYRL